MPTEQEQLEALNSAKFELPGYVYADGCYITFNEADVRLIFLDRDPASATGPKARIGVAMTRPAFEMIFATVFAKAADAMRKCGFEMMTVDGKPQ